MNRSSCLGCLCAVLIFHAPLRAGLIYDNGAPGLTNGFEITHWIEANQFTLGSAVILGSIKFWDAEASASFQSSIWWEIRANSAANVPGPLLFSGSSSNLVHVATGRRVLGVYPEFVNTFDFPSPSLPAGSYWLLLHNGPLSNNVGRDIFWESAINVSISPSLSDEAPFAGNWQTNSTASQLAFQLNGVPESFRPVITAFAFQNGMPRISFTTMAGQNYRVEYRNNVIDTPWTPLPNAGNVAGTGSVVQVTDLDPNVANQLRRFYRVVLLTESSMSADSPPNGGAQTAELVPSSTGRSLVETQSSPSLLSRGRLPQNAAR